MPRAAQLLPDAEALEHERGIDLELCQCAGCGLLQLSSDAVPYYREVIRASAFSEEMIRFRNGQFAAFLEEFSLKGQKVIELGCGRGEFLSILQELGAEAHGLEHSELSVRECVGRGLRVSRGFLQSGADHLNESPFHAFFILNFLEHLPHPNSTLSAVRHHLTNNGVGLVEVPNMNMMLRQRLFSELTSDHLLYFTRETLESTLRLNGFDILRCSQEFHEYILSAVVRKRGPVDLSDFNRQKAEIKVQVHQYVSRFDKVAVWGAGHQALAALSLLDLKEKIRYVVDAAPFKQGKFTPATHIPIVPPEALDSDPVNAIIVMAAGYSDEVAGIIRRKHGGAMAVSILRDFGLEAI